MNIKRISTALIGAPIIILLLSFGNTKIIDIFMALVAIRSIYEYCNCAKNICKPIKWVAYIPAFGLAFLHTIPNNYWQNIIPIIIPIFLLLLFMQVIVTDGETTYKDFVYTVSGALYIISFIAFFSLLYGAKNGKLLIWYVMFSAWGSDTLAYIIGKHFGKHKFSKISPNKTIEGCIAGLVGAIIFGLIYTYFINKFFDINLGYWKIAIITGILGAIGQIGDFSASVIKRHFEVKDFSDLFPGHGGMIDRIDSIIFIAPFAYYIFIVLLG